MMKAEQSDKYLVSACLLGENCKYNGGNNLNEKLLRSLEGCDIISICPELMGGLSTPRAPGEIVDGVVRNEDGTSVDEEYRKGAELALELALREGVTKAILQSRSPSCGASQIYDGTFSGKLIPGMGVCAAKLADNGIEVIDVATWVADFDEDEL